MYTSPLFTALSQAILASLAYGLIIYTLLKMALYVFKDLSSSWRYSMLYSGMVLILTSFIISFFRFYNSASAISESLTGTVTASHSEMSNLSWSHLAIPYAYWVGWIYWSERLENLKVKLRISKSVRLHVSEKLLVPFTAGFLKPIILFPLASINQLSVEQVEAILLHELAHIKRHDYLLNILQRVMEIVLFFNPIIWLVATILSCSILRIQLFMQEH
jgi:bla regulator protein BlaR1